MVCPFCHKSSSVINSRLQKRSNTVWRRRTCPSCQAIWTTTEHAEPSSLYRIEKDGSLHIFHVEILYMSLYESLRHRNTPELDTIYVQKTVLERILKRKLAIIPRQELIAICLDILRRYDKTAYAVYKAMHLV